MAKISVVINTLNEEINLPQAIKSVKSFADEIIVVDMHSSDDTQKIAKKAGAKVFKYKKMGYVEPARNFAISKATGDWVFILDADERIHSSLSKVLKKKVNDNEADYFAVPRKNLIFGKWIQHSRWWPDYNIRFFKKGAVSWSDEIHSVPITTGKGKDLLATESNAIEHHHYESVEQYVNRMNRYTSIQARESFESGTRATWQDFISKPLGEFISRYFAGQGYKDGVHGLALAALQALSELVYVLKLWQYGGFAQSAPKLVEIASELRKSQKEFNYWISDALIHNGASVTEKLRRRLRV